MSIPHAKFNFDTVFDADGAVAFASPRPKRTFSIEEAEAQRQVGLEAGERQALESAAGRQADALEAIAAAARHALGSLSDVAHAHRTGSAELALACAKAIADAALARFPLEPLRAAMESLAREIEAAPRLIIHVDPDVIEALEPRLAQTAQAIGYPGQIIVRPQTGRAAAAFTLDFGDGAASYDPQAAVDRVTAALTEALAAEGLHAEPLIAATEVDPHV